MERLFGLMPTDEIEKDMNYKDGNDLTVYISAGPHGWTILWSDGSTNYKDVDDTTENNFQEAYNKATDMVGKLTENSTSPLLKAFKSAFNACEAMAMDVD